MAFDLSQFISRFVEEAREHVAVLNNGMREIENGSGDNETINRIFRSAHTLKGSSRMLKLISVSEVAHKLEDTFGALRAGEITFSKDLGGILYKGIDTISALLDKIATGDSIDDDQSELLGILADAAIGKIAAAAVANKELPRDAGGEAGGPGTAAQSVPKVAKKILDSCGEARKGNKPAKRLRMKESIRVNTDKLNELIRMASEITSNHGRAKHQYQEIHALAKQVELLARKASAGRRGMQSPPDVDLGRRLHLVAKKLSASSAEMRGDFLLQELLIRGLQEKSLNLRMLPLGSIFDTFHRTVREIADNIGKDIQLEIAGSEIEMDKKIIEKLGDPLVHMFRNAIDHGIEASEERKAAGKPETGVIRLAACYEGGKVLIIMEDDGQGLSVGKIKEKALSSSLATRPELDRMSVSEIYNLIFSPGFSTSTFVTDISGRGVGMDVVKKNIVDELKGSIEILSEEGKGTAFKIRLPMTLAIMHVVVVGVGSTKFALPDNYISEIIKVKTKDILDVFDRKAINIRDQLVPVEDLQEILGIRKKEYLPGESELLVVVKAGTDRLGLIVDSVLDEDDMVIKSLPGHMKNNKMVFGVIITGLDQVVSVLNVPSVFQAAKQVKGGLAKKATLAAERHVHILVVDDSINTREIEKSILESYGYTVTLAEDGVEALEKARGNSYDLVITDVEMPRMDGFTLTEKLRAEQGYKNTPIMLLTSRDKADDKRRGIQVGANAYILKGDFEQSNLIATIESLI